MIAVQLFDAVVRLFGSGGGIFRMPFGRRAGRAFDAFTGGRFGTLAGFRGCGGHNGLLKLRLGSAGGWTTARQHGIIDPSQRLYRHRLNAESPSMLVTYWFQTLHDLEYYLCNSHNLSGRASGWDLPAILDTFFP